MKRYVMWFLLGSVALASSFMAGQWLSPTKTVEVERVRIETVTETQWRDRVVYVQAADQHTETTTTTTPDGGTTTHTVIDTHVDTAADATASGETTTDTVQVVERERIVERSRPSLALEASAIVGLQVPIPLEGWQLQAQVRVLGPLWLGVGVEHASGSWRGMATVRVEF